MTRNLERLLEGARRDSALLQELRSLAQEPEAIVRWAGSHGYALTAEEAAELAACDRELDDDALEQVAGGEDGWGTPPPPNGEE